MNTGKFKYLSFMTASVAWWVSLSALGKECPPVVLADGPEETVIALTEKLQALNIETAVVDGCPATEVTVEEKEGEFLLRIPNDTTDDYTREVESIETAAVLIDTIIRGDEAMPSTPEPEGPARREAPPAVVPPATPEQQILVPLRLLFEVAFGYDVSLWTGARASGCGNIGPVCLGIHFRFSNDTSSIGHSHADHVNRLAMEGGFYLHIEKTWGRLALYPGMTLGGGYYSTRHHPEIDGENKERPLDSTGGFRGELFLALAVRLTDHLYLEVLSLTGSLSAPLHTHSYEGNNEADSFSIDEPRGYLSGCMGIRYDLSVR